MAKLKGVAAGNWDMLKNESWEDYNKRTKALFKTIKTIRFPVADGYAFYKVESETPLVLSHVPYGDSWTIPEAYMRGLTLKDVKQMLAHEEALVKLFSKKE